MTSCPYCTKPATMTIIASPQRVCSDHALEFWTGLLVYTRGRSGACVKHEAVCDCILCEEQGASRLRELAINMSDRRQAITSASRCHWRLSDRLAPSRSTRPAAGPTRAERP